MTVYYCDCDLATGDDDGGGDGTTRTDPTDAGNWTHAWKTFQQAIDGSTAAGDIVYCRGTEASASVIDMDTVGGGASGTAAGGYVRFIGCNSSTGAVDGSYFIIDGTAGSDDCINWNARSYVWFENIKVQNAADDGIDMANAYSDNCVFSNVWCYNSFDNGVKDAQYARYAVWHRCKFSSNGEDGLNVAISGCTYLFCSFDNNTANGVGACSGGVFFGCLFFENGADGADAVEECTFINCVFDANTTHGIDATEATAGPVIVGCRITNHISNSGVNLTDERCVLDACYLKDNGTPLTAERYDELHVNGASLCTLSGGAGETDDGYEAQGDDDYNLATGATGYSQAVVIP